VSDVEPEPPRHGEGTSPCGACARPDESYLWAGAGWRLSHLPEAQAVPAMLFEPRRHADLGDLSEDEAAQLGVLVLRIERALASVPGVARVHVNRWGDGGAHLHVWFFARPAGLLQLRGSYLPDWAEILPALPDSQWAAVGRHVAEALSGHG